MVQFTLRLPDDVHRRMAEAAEKARRSLNGQIVRVLERWLEQETERDEQAKK